jgi:hypothetical protein
MLWNQDSKGNYNADNSAGFFPYQTPAQNPELFNTLPSVRFSKILFLIEEKSGLQFIFSPSIQQRLRNTVLLCNTKNDTGATIQEHPLIASVIGTTSNNDRYFRFNSSIICNSFQIHNEQIFARRDVEKTILNLNISANVGSFYAAVNFVIVDDDGNRIFSQAMKRNGDLCTLDGNYEINLVLNAGIYMFIEVQTSGSGVFHLEEINADSTITINQFIDHENMYDDFGEVPFPGWFPVYANLPAISTIDFIKSIGWMFGLYATRKAVGCKKHCTLRAYRRALR